MAGSAFNPGQWGRKVAAGVGAAVVAGSGTIGYIWWNTGQGSPQAPKCFVAAPTAGATLTAAAPLTATCTASVAFASFQVDGSTVDSASAPYSYSWNSGSVSNGSHTVAVVACTAGADSCTTSTAVTVTTSNVGPPVNTVAPVASGSPAVGQTLSCTTGTWTGDVSSGYSYLWKDAGGNIASATSSTYTIAVGENGATIHCNVTASGTGGTANADSNSLGPVTSGGTLFANEWVSPTGSDSGSACVRFGTATVAPTAANACATPQKACSLASGGDVVGVMAGTYTVGFNLTGCNPASTLTYENTPGGFVAFAPASTITASSNIVLQGDQVGHGVGFSLGYTTFSGGSGAVNTVALNNVNVYCQATSPWNVITSGLTGEVACNASMQFTGAVNGVTWNGGDESDWATCLTSCTHTGTTSPIHNTIDPGPTNITVEHITISNYFDLDNNGSAGDHSEAWMIRGGSNILFADNRFTDCAPPVSTGYARNNSCNSSYVFFGQSGSSNTTGNVTFTQNIIDPGYGTNDTAFQYAYDAPAGTQFSLTLLYNDFGGGLTVCGSSTANKCGPGTGSNITGTNVTMVGNIGLYPSFGTCFSAGTYSHNVWFFTSNAAHCVASDTTLNSTAPTVIWTSPGATGFDYSLTAGTSPALGAGENVYCPATDINGRARPTLAACDAGAIQH